MKSNVEIIQDIVEQVVNQKRVDIYDQYISQDYISRGAPYVGTGFSVDSSGNKHIIKIIAPGSPAEGKLQVGDELLWAEDEHQHWATYEDIKQGILQSYRGSKYKVGVRRGNQTLEYEFTRDLIKGFDTPKDQAKSDLREFMTKEFPDLEATIMFLSKVRRVTAMLPSTDIGYLRFWWDSAFARVPCFSWLPLSFLALESNRCRLGKRICRRTEAAVLV